MLYKFRRMSGSITKPPPSTSKVPVPNLSSPYLLTVYQQVQAVTVRRIQILRGNMLATGLSMNSGPSERIESLVSFK
jgi:hypothetical protein